MRQIDYSIVIPVYRSNKSLKIIVEKFNTLFSTQLQDKTYEIIFVNDSPFDQTTVKSLDEIYTSYTQIKVIKLTKNFGQQSAILCGISYAKGEYIITMDDDLQHDPYDITKLIEWQHHDIVIAKFTNKQHHWFKKITSKIKGYFDHIILQKPRHIVLTPFRLFNKNIATNILKINTPYPFIPALLFAVSTDVVNVEIKHHKRIEGQSNYTLKKMIQLFNNLLINNSSLLLKTIGFVGICISFFSIIYAITIIYKKIFLGVTLVGWSSIMVSILFFGGMIMFSLGIIGEYLIRIIHTSEKRPHYFIKEIKE